MADSMNWQVELSDLPPLPPSPPPSPDLRPVMCDSAQPTPAPVEPSVAEIPAPAAIVPPALAPQPEPPQPQSQITLLLLSGSRKTFSFPPETTVGRVKELVWGSWPVEWRDEQVPPSPSYFRLLHLGRMLQDDSTLASNNLLPLPSGSSVPPPIVHLSIKSFVPPVDSSKASKKHKKTAGSVVGVGVGDESPDEEGVGCCGGCVVM
ncbi:hypothetical protein DACRYDRAFT_117972 [Dacryopinax primogenitus]|uniref:Ubiquitin-like domain-containing protein n=1 Tax=Dacryopinax primogenitus (strain DJM 731) TaxID=1858805 RepID=M5G631_DACPD|nr:uncharacterized protein DACRYDRAFT_117972 [Dacryopinax primogenitus]EJT99202.1 hypothetical protein DACRYDRAFT_117972 [Dacryopinax primogenitus]